MSGNGIFDPEEGADYGLCLDCGTKLATEPEASAEEITEALKWHSDFSDAWQEYVEAGNS